MTMELPEKSTDVERRREFTRRSLHKRAVAGRKGGKRTTTRRLRGIRSMTWREIEPDQPFMKNLRSITGIVVVIEAS